MDLSRYEAMMESRMACAPFPIPVEELRERYLAVSTAMVNDVLREEGLLRQALPGHIVPLREGMRLCGTAFTIQGGPSLSVKNEMEERARMLESIPADSVVVWDTSGDTVSAQWGEMMTRAAMRQGCRGAVVDGGVRDTAGVLARDFPLFCRYRSSNGMLGRFRITGWQIPVEIGEVQIYPGDVVLGDLDGVLVVPRHLAYSVLRRAEDVRSGEEDIARMIENGVSPGEIVARGGYF